MNKTSIAILLLLIASIIYIPASTMIASARNYNIASVEAMVLEDTTYNATFIGDYNSNQERTGNTGGIVYNDYLGYYLVAWVNITNPTYSEGDLYARVINAETHEYIDFAIDTGGSVVGIDTVVAGRESFLIGYTRWGGSTNKYDAYVALIRYDGTSFTYTRIPLATTADNFEEYVSAAFLVDRYLVVVYNSSDKKLYGYIVDEEGNVILGKYIAYTGLAYNSPDLGFMVISGPYEWLVLYSTDLGEIHGKKVTYGGYVYSTSIAIPGKLYTAHGGAYINSRYIVPYKDGYSVKVAIIKKTSYKDWSVTTYTLSTNGAFPFVVEGDRYALVVWKDTSGDSSGNVYGVIVYPENDSISNVIDIGRDTGNSYKDDHIFAAYNYQRGYFVVAWRSNRDGGADDIYITTVSECGKLGSIALVRPTGYTEDYVVHGVESGKGEVFVAAKYYPSSDNADAHLVIADLGTDVGEPARCVWPEISLEIYFTPWNVEEARSMIYELILRARHNVSIAVYHIGNHTYYGDYTFAYYIVEAAIKSIYRLGKDNVRVVIDESLDYYAEAKVLDTYGVLVKDTDTSYIMHNKFIVIDRQVVILSSANFDYKEVFKDRNFIVVINNTDIASRFEEEFNELWSGTFHGGTPTANPSFTTIVNGTTTKVWTYFTPDDCSDNKNFIRWLIQNANESVHLMMFDLTDDDIASDLKTAYENGIDVRVILEKDQYNEHSDINDYDYLVDNGVLATLDKDDESFHIKAMVVDHSVVYIGSAQYTVSGFQYNDEYMLIINHTGIAQLFEQFFEHWWRRYTACIDVVADLDGSPASGVQITVVDYGNGTDITRTYTTDSNGVAHVYLVHPYYYVNVTDQDYTLTITYTGFPSTTKTFTLSTGDVESLTIHYVTTTLSASGPTTGKVEETYTYDITLSGTTTTPSTASVDVTINGNPYKTVTVTSGSGSVDIKFNYSGTYTVEYSYAGGEETVGTNEYNVYKSSSYTMTVTISTKSTTTTIVSIEPDSPSVGDTITVTARVVLENGTPIAGATLRFVYNGTTENTQTTNESGYAVDTYVPSVAGPLTIEVYYDGEPNKYESSSDSTTITVSPGITYVDTEINITGPDTVYVGDSATYTVRLQYANNHSVIPLTTDIDLYLNGSKQTVTLTNGVYTLTLTLDTPGPFNVTAVFNGTTIGNTVYKPSSGTKITIVKEYTYVDTEIVIDGPSATYVGQTETYTIKLQYAVNHSVIPIDTTVTVYLNGTPQTLSLVGGTNTLSITFSSPGPYNITVVYSGETIDGVVYNPSTATLIVNVQTTPVYETQVVIEGPDTIHLYESVDYTIKLEFTNGTVIAIDTTVTVYINGSSQTISLTSGVGTVTVTPDALGPLNITVVYSGDTVGIVTYNPSSATKIVEVIKRGVTITVTIAANTHWINRTHLFLNISGEVRDSVNNSLVATGYVNIYVKKDIGWVKAVENLPLVNGRYSWSGIVDPPEEVKVEYVDPTGTYTSGEGEGAVATKKLPKNPYAIPAPEPWITALLLLAALLLIIAITKKRF